MTLTDFLLARIAEDEAMADRSIQIGDKGASMLTFGQPDAPPVLVMHPARVLAECEAKRRIVEAYDAHLDAGAWAQAAGLMDALMSIGAVHAGHPDYCEEWRP